MRWMSYLTAMLVMLGMASLAHARNVDLSTVPQRNTVQLTIYNSEDLTLVRETRTVTFKKGNNPLQFSWANTLIDPTSVELKFLTQAGKLEVSDTTYPHDKPQMLYWNVKSSIDGEATIQITYFTSGITWSADYALIAGAGETKVGLEGFVRVFNNSGEEYEDASVRLVVGKVNLVEKIAQLAQIPMKEAAELSDSKKAEFYGQAMRKMIDRADGSATGGAGWDDAEKLREKGIVKEGLSEYFIFSIEGTETIPNGWSKRLRSLDAKDIPVKIQYRYRPVEYGDQLVRMYLLTNDVLSKLGESPLPDGVFRIFRENGRGGLSYLTQQSLKYIPIGDKVELNLGQDPEVIFDLVKQKCWRENIWMVWNGGWIKRRVGDGAMAIDVNATVSGWDDHVLYGQRIRNYTSKPIEVEVRRSFDGDVTFLSGLPGLKLFDFRTPEFTVSVDAGKKGEFNFEVVTRQGDNAKQNRVELGKPK